MSAHETILLKAFDYGTLRQAVADVAAHGRLRTSTEVHGTNTPARAHMIESLAKLERLGLVSRRARDWSSGTVTPHGRRVFAKHPVLELRKRPRTDRGIAADGGTRFKKALYEVRDTTILVHGQQSAKLGRTVTKGPHRGLPMRYITLEEGRTCPSDCALRPKCYGGNMPLAKRIIWRGEETGKAIADAVAKAGPVMLRLHNLGDFPSFGYAQRMLAAIKQAGGAAFGYTHHQPETEIGKQIRAMAAVNWDHFAIRTSYKAGTRKPILTRSAVIVERPEDAAAHNAVVCPEQLGKVASCAACGYCWHSQRPVAFVMHERLSGAAATLPPMPQIRPQIAPATQPVATPVRVRERVAA